MLSLKISIMGGIITAKQKERILHESCDTLTAMGQFNFQSKLLQSINPELQPNFFDVGIDSDADIAIMPHDMVIGEAVSLYFE